MAQAQTPSGSGSVRPKIRAVVEIGTTFGNYSILPYAVPLNCTLSIAPNIGSAAFLYRYAEELKRTDKYSFSSYDPQDNKDYYVRFKTIGSNPINLWAGYVQIAKNELWGKIAGKQLFEAYELSHKLTKVEIGGAWVYQNLYAFRIDTAPSFNISFNGTPRILGNKSDGEIGERFYFGNETTPWSNYDMVRYLLGEVATETGLTFKLSGLVEPLKRLHDVIHIQGRNVFDILNDVINRNRGLGWMVNALGSAPEIVVFPILDQPIKIGEIEIPANTKTSNLTASRIDTRISVLNSFGSLFDQIVVYGQPILKMHTLGLADAFEKTWTDEVETELKDPIGEGKLDDVLTGEESEEYKIALADQYRLQEKFKHVWTRFRIKRDWDFVQSGGIEGGEAESVLMSCADNGIPTIDEAAKMYLNSKRFETFLPLREGFDYGKNGPTDLQPEGSEITYLAPFAFAKQPDSDVPEGGEPQFFFMHAPLDDYEIAGARLNILNRDFAVQLGTRFPLYYAKGIVDGNKTNYIPMLSYEYIYFTLAFRLDQRLKVTATRKGVDTPTNKKFLYVPDAEYWQTDKNCVIDIRNGKLQYLQNNPDSFATQYVLRDDSERLFEIATFALAWYGTPRAMVDVEIEAIQKFVDLGTMLKTVTQNPYNEIQANTIVSSISYDLSGTGVTRIRTNWMEFDYPEA